MKKDIWIIEVEGQDPMIVEGTEAQAFARLKATEIWEGGTGTFRPATAEEIEQADKIIDLDS